MRWPGAVKKTRCDFCSAAPVAWLWYKTTLPYRGPYRSGGVKPMNAATCAEHEGCPGWAGMIALHPEGRIERAA